MEDLFEEKSCGCSEHCACGEDCNCTKDNKCCEECACDANCNCNDNCTCEDACECTKDNKCNEECTCGNDCKCNETCQCDNCECDENNRCDEPCNCNNGCQETCEDEKCACGCGESIEQDNVADAYFKQLLSLRAEFDNYRKRTQNDIGKAYSNGFNEAITQFIPALDSFKMATEYICDPNTLVGIQYIEKGILSTLEKMGVTVIEATGQFDPEVHQAIGSEVSSTHASGEIIKECFKGFKLGDRVIRYSQVIVAK